MRYIVTGANGGMGRAICLALCGQGHEVIGLDINVPEESAGVHYLRADVTDENSVAQAVEAGAVSQSRYASYLRLYELSAQHKDWEYKENR